MPWDYLIGDCRGVLRLQKDKSIHCAVTSPPYFRLRSYFLTENFAIDDHGAATEGVANDWAAEAAITYNEKYGDTGAIYTPSTPIEWHVRGEDKKKVLKGYTGRILPVAFWGGDADCDHKLEKMVAPTITHKAGNKTPCGLQKTKARYWGSSYSQLLDEPESYICVKCGAWLGQLGQEPDPSMYISNLVEIFREVRRVLRDDATLWINIGDSHAGGGGASGHKPDTTNCGRSTVDYGAVATGGTVPNGYKNKDLLGIPHMLSTALRNDGWGFISEIIWAKAMSFADIETKCPHCNMKHDAQYVGSCMPESVDGYRWEKHKIKVGNTGRGGELQRDNAFPEKPQQSHNGKQFAQDAKWEDCPGCDKCNDNDGYVLMKGSWRPTASFEYVFMLTNTGTAYGDREAVREKAVYPQGTKAAKGSSERLAQEGVNARPDEYAVYDGYRNLRSVWAISPKGYKAAHFAVFPEEIIIPIIKSSTSEKGCCPACGAPYARVVVKGTTSTGTDTEAERTQPDPSEGMRRCPEPGQEGAGNTARTVGWRPTCTCKDAGAPIPATVLDPFVGSGTVLKVARDLGRSAVGVDINPDYYDLGRDRAMLDLKDITGY